MLDKLHMADLHYQRGVVLEKAGRIVEAVEEYRQALQANPRLRAAHSAIASYYMRNGLTAKAVDSWSAALAIEPDYDTQASLASALIDLRRYEEARTMLQECLRWIPDDAFASFELAYIDYTEHQYTAAYQRLLDLRPIYNDEWQLHHLLGNCQIRLALLDSAMASFGRAALLAVREEHLEEVQSSIEMVERYTEFAQITTLKELLYAEHGLLVLGTYGDDGLNVQEYDQLSWQPIEIATTLRRLALLRERKLWSATALLALNRSAEPIAQALAARLELPLRQPSELTSSDVALVICGNLDTGPMLEVLETHLPCSSLVLALALAWEPQEQDMLPDIIGVRAHAATLPWDAALTSLRQASAPRATITELLASHTATILAAWDTLTPEPNAAAQIAWYRDVHTRIALPNPDLE